MGVNKLKILLVSDIESKYLWDHFEKEKFSDIDLVISCGDIKAEYMSFLATVINAPFLYVHGNHDISLLNEPPEGCECIDGKLLVVKGLRILGLGGSMKYNGDIFQFTKNEMNKRILKLLPRILLNKGFDILVTHAGGFNLGDLDDPCHMGFSGFNRLIDRFKPKYFFHGHSHLNYDLKNSRIIECGETKIINAYDHFIVEY